MRQCWMWKTHKIKIYGQSGPQLLVCSLNGTKSFYILCFLCFKWELCYCYFLLGFVASTMRYMECFLAFVHTQNVCSREALVFWNTPSPTRAHVGVMLREGTGVRPDPQLISDCISLCEQACEVGTDEEGLAKMKCQKRVGSAPGPLLWSTEAEGVDAGQGLEIFCV